jgi:hypothetical protein
MALQNETPALYKGLYACQPLVVNKMLVKEEYTIAGPAQVARLLYIAFSI